MRRLKQLLAILLLSIPLTTFAQWRSELYPESWEPGYEKNGLFLHDFSYAGYHSGLQSIPESFNTSFDVTKAPYAVDNTGTKDVTTILQHLIDSIGKAGGGVLFLPQGTYKLSVPESQSYALRIQYPNTVILGAGTDKTYLKNTTTLMRGKTIIRISPANSGSWYSESNAVFLSEDITKPTKVVSVSDASSFSLGDTVVLKHNVTSDFDEEHNMRGEWAYQVNGAAYLRYIEKIDYTTNTIHLDCPIRYLLLQRDSARMYKAKAQLSEIGLSNFSIGNVENTTADFEDQSYLIEGTGAYQVHAASAISISNTINSWLSNVNTYKPEENTNDYHLLSRGINVIQSRHLTFSNCEILKPIYQGGGGNGYNFVVSGSDCLFQNCTATHGRHNFTFAGMHATGNVLHHCSVANGSLPTDMHNYLSAANLFDNTTVENDYLESIYRPSGDPLHGHPSTQTTYWNTNGVSYYDGAFFIIDSRQFGNGYVIGTRGSANRVNTFPSVWYTEPHVYDSSPTDYVEGQGEGDSLEPQSLYSDQLSKRKERLGLATPNAINTKSFYNVDKRQISVYLENTNGVVKLYSLSGKMIINKAFKSNTQIEVPNSGIYILSIANKTTVNTHKVLIK